MAGQSTRDIKRRIQSVDSIQQVTKAMEMVSAAKLRRAQGRVLAARPFANRIAEVLAHVVVRGTREDGTLSLRHPLLLPRSTGRVVLCAISADRGLAGGYNANLGRALDSAVRAQEAEGRSVDVVVVGRKARDWMRRAGRPTLKAFVDLGDHVEYSKAQEVARALIEPYAGGRVDQVLLLYSQFVSAMVARPVIFPLLPVPPEGPRPWTITLYGPMGGSIVPPPADEQQAGGRQRPDGRTYIFEPSVDEVAGVLLSRYVDVEVYRALLEAKASEHGARMTAMHSASDNAGEMIEALTLSFNRARQAGITKEISEIVGGAQALASQT